MTGASLPARDDHFVSLYPSKSGLPFYDNHSPFKTKSEGPAPALARRSLTYTHQTQRVNKMTIVHIGKLLYLSTSSSVRLGQELIAVSFKSSGDASARQSLVEAFKALKTECVHPETKKPYIQSFKCGKQDSPEGKHRDMDFVFMMEFEVGVSLKSHS